MSRRWPDQERVCVGAVSGARGVKGELRIKPFTQDPEDVGAYGPVETEDGERCLNLSVVSVSGDEVIARLDGVETRDQALALKGTRLYVPKDKLPLPGEDEFYFADLVGLAVVTKEMDRIGQVIAVHDFGAGDLLEIRLDRESREVMLPFTRDCVPTVDLAGERIVIDPPEGLFDLPSDDEEGGKA